MKGYTEDEELMLAHIALYKGPYEAHILEIANLQVSMPGEGIVAIDATPHFQYTLGDKEPYKAWLIEQNHLYNESLASFEYIMSNDFDYLDGPHAQHFILHTDELVIVDGVHRATRLFQLGILQAPVLRKI